MHTRKPRMGCEQMLAVIRRYVNEERVARKVTEFLSPGQFHEPCCVSAGETPDRTIERLIYTDDWDVLDDGDYTYHHIRAVYHEVLCRWRAAGRPSAPEVHA